MTDYQKKQRIVLEVNPNRPEDFYPKDGMPDDEANGLLKDAGKRLPLNDRVIVNIIKESTSSWNLFTQGYLDGVGVGTNNYSQAVATNGLLTPDLKQKGVMLRKDPQVNVYYAAFNMKDPVFGGLDEKHKKLRQAISLSIDSDEYIDLLRQGNGVPAQWLLPPSVFGYEADWKNPYRQTNVEKAKQLLAEAGYPDGNDPATGNKLVLNYDNSATNAAGRMQVGILQRQIERIGIKLESRSTPANIFQDKLLKGQHQFITYGWFADYPDPENFVFLLYGPNRKPGPNSADYQNPEYDKLFEKMRSMEDGPARKAIILQMRQIAVEDCAWIPLYHDVALSLNYSWMGNVKAHPIANDTVMYRSIDTAKRAERQAEWNMPVYLPVFFSAGWLNFKPLPGGKCREAARQSSPTTGGREEINAVLYYPPSALRYSHTDWGSSHYLGVIFWHGLPRSDCAA